MSKMYIRLNFQFEHTHQWLGAPNEVDFLRYPHRHVFHVEATIEVHHDDRDLEFIMVKRHLEKYVQTWKVAWPTTVSCEQIAQYLIDEIKNQYGGDRYISVSVYEDGENGAIVVDE